MIIKKADDRISDIKTLKNLRALPYITDAQVKRVDRELVALRSGLKGEREAAYHIDFHYGDSLNYAIIHDLRIEHDGHVAQIDHLIIGRMLTGFLCETKYWSDGVSITPEGEFSAHYGQKAFGIPSPIMQNARHIKLLTSVLASNRINRPKRMGMKIPITLNPITLVSTGASIRRPSGKTREKFTEVIKADQFDEYIQVRADENTSVFSIGRLIAADTLRSFAQSIAALHAPIRINYAAKFGILAPSSPPTLEQTIAPAVIKQIDTLEPTVAPPEKVKSPKAYQCATCSAPVELKVARFCWFNKPRFNGEIRCRAHQ